MWPRAAAEISSGDCCQEKTNSEGQLTTTETDAWRRQETPSWSTERHTVVAMQMHLSGLLLWESDILSWCPTWTHHCTHTKVMIISFPRHRGEGTKAGLFHEMQDSSKNNCLKDSPQIWNLPWRFAVVCDSSSLSPSTGVRLPQVSESSWFPCSLLQEISCIHNPILAFVLWQTQTNILYVAILRPMNWVLLLSEIKIDHTQKLSWSGEGLNIFLIS